MKAGANLLTADRFFLPFNRQLDSNIFGRNRDRAVEWSPALEKINQALSLLLSYAFHAKTQAHRVEQGNIFSRRAGAIHRAMDIDGNSCNRNRLGFRQYLHQFDSAGGDSRKEQLRGSDRFAGTSILHRTVYHEVMIPSAAYHAPKSFSRNRPRFIFAHI